ncbi:unnamed protein product [Nippostrongylus brasiliensis]|uniref:RRP12-like protein n=1 Tax=Nippostrongylus brasiliensis TaxID=27835 RepID=A0A158R232_NIPBR|nr:unnamed protein product [Nippostrongylus brasiliensis]
MTTAVKWRAAFKEIYGHTPTKTDYGLAPQQVREEHKAECPPSPAAVVEEQPRKGGVRLKRPNLDAERCSPLKRRPPKARRLCLDGPAPLRTSPRKNPKSTPSTSGILSPTLPVFKSLFDTPEKGTPLSMTIIVMVLYATDQAIVEVIQVRQLYGEREKGKTCKKNGIISQNAEYLLMPTPEKRETKEVLEPFLAEEVTKKKPVTAKKGLAVAFSAEKGRVIERPFKRPKKNDGNFVRINMKKKSFTRGKVSAEQKRKMRRKQNWKRRFGGGGKV